MKQEPDLGKASGTTWLFVPGDRPDRFAKAVASGADQVVLDLEDAVAPADKDEARSAIAAWLSGGGAAWVRVNAADTPWHAQDLAVVRRSPGLRGVLVPKAEGVDALAAVAAELPTAGLVALVETARGVQRAAEMADSGHVDRLALGSIDLALDLGAEEDDEPLLLARSMLVLASRAAGLEGPVDGVTTVTDDPATVTAAASRARALGFAGKLCVHPAQVPAVVAAFAPSDSEMAWALRVEAAASQHAGGAFALDGQMVDRPVLARARAVLARRP